MNDGGQDRQIEAIAATCGLLHDLGNPPFGHSGEDAIQEWFKTKLGEEKLRQMLDGREELVQDFLQFEGNAQTLRIVTKLQVLADFNGLNLSYGTLSALCKYTASSMEAKKVKDHAKSKPGYFTSELDRIKQIREMTGTGDARNPIAFLVEAADDIVYSVADIEDGIKKHILSWDDLEDELINFPNDWDATKRDTATSIIQNVLEFKKRILAPSPAPDDLPDDIHAAAFRTAAIGVLVQDASEVFQAKYNEIMAGAFKEELVTAGKTAIFVERLKEIGRKKIYCTHSNLKLELMGRKVIQDLMTLFWEGASTLPLDGVIKPKAFKGKVQALLSQQYRKVFEHFAKPPSEYPEPYHRLQLVTDYVCGMTDTFAKRLHAELMNG